MIEIDTVKMCLDFPILWNLSNVLILKLRVRHDTDHVTW